MQWKLAFRGYIPFYTHNFIRQLSENFKNYTFRTPYLSEVFGGGVTPLGGVPSTDQG